MAQHGPGVQAQLTETTFQQRLEGYSQIVPQDLIDAKGGKIRYAIDTLGPSGQVVSTVYRLGGMLTSVDPQMRYIRLLNPYSQQPNSERRGVTWSVQLEPPPGKRLRLWYMPPASRDEVILFRKLLQQLEDGEVRITRIGQ